ncbi:MAG: penicillin-binding protein activator LpoB [Bdellovibrionales bacterium RIFOXYC1_FULL_54_43]|nr:MAG: penicillin-binding protein activator LpoB [Bdellovibrionales bacterium RIFOXYC1_FULL_54_43]OFZ78619.1 MAG: penicillin-binding protein activator LpoB [Bdellovibrionales bacterium RIFOXYD1_FULL_55_31]HLD99671.1 penicillin-binding protein activator LpoB [Bdellovibrionota bacterium]
MNRHSLTVNLLGILAVLAMIASGCGPRAFTKGEYDDPTRVELLDDKFNEADMQQMADTVIKAMVACDYVSKAPKAPVVIVERVQNRTEEHIDTVSMTDKIRTALIKSGKVRFVNKEERATLSEEYDYNSESAGNVAGPTAKKRGKQIGADYILSGALATNIQQVGDDKFIYYKLTMNLTNMEQSTIDCTEEREIRKKFRKRSVGL